MKSIKAKINRMFREQLITVGLRVTETIEQSVAEEIKKSIYVDQLIASTNRYQQAIESENRQNFEDIKELFKIRKNLFGTFYDMAYGLTASRDAEDKAAAVRIFAVLNTYGKKKFYGIRQSAVTQRYDSFVETLQKPEFTADIERLKMTGILAELANAHDTYEKTYLEWGNQQSEKTHLPVLRKEMKNALVVVVEEVEYFSKRYPTEANVTLWKNIEQRFAEVYVTGTKAASKESTTTATVPAEKTAVVS